MHTEDDEVLVMVNIMTKEQENRSHVLRACVLKEGVVRAKVPRDNGHRSKEE